MNPKIAASNATLHPPQLPADAHHYDAGSGRYGQLTRPMPCCGADCGEARMERVAAVLIEVER